VYDCTFAFSTIDQPVNQLFQQHLEGIVLSFEPLSPQSELLNTLAHVERCHDLPKIAFGRRLVPFEYTSFTLDTPHVLTQHEQPLLRQPIPYQQSTQMSLEDKGISHNGCPIMTGGKVLTKMQIESKESSFPVVDFWGSWNKSGEKRRDGDTLLMVSFQY